MDFCTPKNTCAGGVDAHLVQGEDVGAGPHQAVVHLPLPQVRHHRPHHLAAVLDHKITLGVPHLGQGTPPMDLALACMIKDASANLKGVVVVVVGGGGEGDTYTALAMPNLGQRTPPVDSCSYLHNKEGVSRFGRGVGVLKGIVLQPLACPTWPAYPTCESCLAYIIMQGSARGGGDFPLRPNHVAALACNSGLYLKPHLHLSSDFYDQRRGLEVSWPSEGSSGQVH